MNLGNRLEDIFPGLNLEDTRWTTDGDGPEAERRGKRRRVGPFNVPVPGLGRHRRCYQVPYKHRLDRSEAGMQSCTVLRLGNGWDALGLLA